MGFFDKVIREGGFSSTKAKCKRADCADLKHFTINNYCTLLTVDCFEMLACT